MMQHEVITQFEIVSSELLSLLTPLKQDQLNKKPFDGSWSAGQIGEHLSKSYGVVETLNGKVRAIEKNSIRRADQKVASVKSLFLNFDIKMSSPKAILPSKKTIDRKVLLRGLRNRISELITVAKYKDLMVVCSDYSIPEYGEFTRLEWMWFNVFHTKRHIHQLEQIIKKIAV